MVTDNNCYNDKSRKWRVSVKELLKHTAGHQLTKKTKQKKKVRQKATGRCSVLHEGQSFVQAQKVRWGFSTEK